MPLRAMTYNILVGGEEREPFIRDIIRSQDPDIIAIQEANDRAVAETLARELGMRIVLTEGGSPYHLALLTRLPIVTSAVHQTPEMTKGAVEIETVWEGRPLRVFNTHFKANPDQEPQRVAEVEALLRLTGPAGDGQTLLMGDFNSLSPVDAFVPDPEIADEDVDFAQVAYAQPRLVIPRVLNAGYVDIFRQRRPGEPGYTAKTPTPVVRIDYIFASPSLAARAVYCDRIESPLVILASDHMPVRADFE